MMYELLMFFSKSMLYSYRKKGVHIPSYKAGGLTSTWFVNKNLHQMQKNEKEGLGTLSINGWARGTKTHRKHKEHQIEYYSSDVMDVGLSEVVPRCGGG